MRLVIQRAGDTISKRIEEKDFAEVIRWIKRNYDGHEEKPKRYELFRYVLKDGGIAVIYRDNRKIRTRNTWIEIRAISLLSRFVDLTFEHSVQIETDSGNIEVDGVNWDTKTMVEVKYQNITQEWINYYHSKMKRLGFNKCYILAKSFDRNLKTPPNIKLYKLELDFKTPLEYYTKRFRFPDWIRAYIPSRHIRFLLSNGRWTGIRKKITETPKYRLEDKFLSQLMFVSRYGEIPIKIYYSMARMVSPVSEYIGKGYPMPYLLLVFDVDAPITHFFIDERGFCDSCLRISRSIAKTVQEKLTSLGYEAKQLYSGVKGVHVYGLKDKEAVEVKPDVMMRLSQDLQGFVDNVNFKGSLGFDIHRIIKLPNSVDLTTGIIIKENFERLKLKDSLIPL